MADRAALARKRTRRALHALFRGRGFAIDEEKIICRRIRERRQESAVNAFGVVQRFPRIGGLSRSRSEYDDEAAADGASHRPSF
jgi:hypothetical protein